MKGVFEVSGNSRYDDAITERYHFPSNYLSVAGRALESDWIVYRETRVSGGRMAYIAAAFVERIDADPSDPRSHRHVRDASSSISLSPTATAAAGLPSAFYARMHGLAMPGEACAVNRFASLKTRRQGS